MSWTLECEAPMGIASPKHEPKAVRKHRLHNGLTLLSLRDDSAPIVAYQTWFAVGSSHERPGATGMAHLFEHLMFNESESLPVGDFDRKIESTGGDTNAATWVDWTYYRDNLPSRDLALGIELEAERMDKLVLSDEVVETERNVVMNERIERVDDDVDGFASEELFRSLFGEHPYHWPTIGWMEDIKTLDIEEIRRFYRSYYVPNNATLVVVGDFDEAELLAKIEAAYGHLAAADLPSRDEPRAPASSGEVVLDFEKAVNAERLLNGYLAPGQGDEDWPVLLMACALLSGGSSSPLHRELIIDKQLASSVSLDLMPFRMGSAVELSVNASRGSSLDEIQECVDRIFRQYAEEIADERAIRKVKNMVETDFWLGLSTAEGKAEALGHYECTHGDFEMLFRMAERMSAVTAEDIRRVVGERLNPAERTVVRIRARSEESAS